MFAGRKLFIATKHGKERVIAPLLEGALGVTCVATPGLDTDVFGTFTGEIERTDDPLTTAKKKCELAMDLYDGDLAVASEGSFGAHPASFFGYADEELLLLKDRTNDLEVVVREISTDTNFGGTLVHSEQEFLDFARDSQFPSHGLILRPEKGKSSGIVKGIRDEKVLLAHFRQLLSSHGAAFVETDMRAMYNPTRMGVIECATRKLVERVNSLCPRCEWPGFGVVRVIAGLPCRQCCWPTRSIRTQVYACAKCNYQKSIEVLDWEQPEFCDHCNP